MVLNIIFEDIFLDCSHGSRPGRSCHTALKYLQLNIGNASIYTWVIEGGIKRCFDNILAWSPIAAKMALSDLVPTNSI